MKRLGRRQRIVLAGGAVLALLLAWLLLSRTSGGRAADSGGAGPTPAGAAGGAGGVPRPGARPPDPRTSPRASIEGRVLDGSGHGVASARVCAEASSSELVTADLREPSCVDARSDGRYRLEGLMTARWTVQAEARGFLPGRWRGPDKRSTIHLAPAQRRTGIDVVLAAGGVEVRGRVKDISGGVVAGALVTISSDRWWSGRAASSFTRSNEQGEFVAWTAPGAIRVEARAEGYGRGSSEGTAPGQTIEVLLTPESVLVGRVVEAGGARPVPGAIVSAGGEAGGAMGWRQEETDSALTDAEGRFRLEGLAPGRYKPSALAAGRFGEAPESVLLGLGQTSAEIVIEAHPAIEVAGRVVDGATKEGCREGTVSLTDDALGRDEWAETDEDGAVRFKAVLPGDYRVEAWCDEHVQGEGYPHVVVKDEPIAGLVWEVKRGLAMRGQVVDGAGHPVARANLWGTVKGGDPRGQRGWGHAETEDDGRFEMAGLITGTYVLHVSAADQPEPKTAPEVVLDKGDVNDVRIVLDAAGTVEGVVVDDGGQPVAGIEVRARGERWSWGESARSRDDGGFTLKGLRPGDYRVYASRNWDAIRAPGTTDDDLQGARVTIAAGRTERVRLVIEARRGEIRGRVLDERGKAVADAFVDAERESDSKAAAAGAARRELRWAWGEREPVLTDLDGRFTVGKLARGAYTVHAFRKGGGEAVAEHVAAGGSVTLTIRATGAVAGTVAGPDGKPPDEFTITASDEKEGFEREERFFRTGGRFALHDLPAGDYDVGVSAPEGTDREEVVLAEGQEKGGLVLELEARARVHGRVLALDDDRPVPGMSIAVAPAHGGDFSGGDDDEGRRNITDREGRFEIERAPAGKVLVNAWPVEWETAPYSWTQTTATLEAGRDNELPPLRVARARLKPFDRGGDLGFTTREQPPDVELEDLRWEIAVIRPGGPAEGSGLRVGDVITSVDGHDVTGPNAYLYWSLSRAPTGTAIAFGLARGETVTITTGKPP